MPSLRGSLATAAILWKSLKSAGFDPAPLFLQVNIDPELMKDPHARVSEDIQLKDVADCLAVSARTLQRRLKNEETSFANLLEEIRRDLASRYILDNTLCLTEISFLLGFSDESAFSRAFKRWTGKSPSEYSHRP